MSIEKGKTALELFEAALEVTPPERARWIQKACGDDDPLAAEVHSLLAAHDAAGDFLEAGPLLTPAPPDDTPSPARELAIGMTLGDFVVERQIGAGGMGLVYRARQPSLNRPVALKILPPHLRHSASARLRFQREVEAAARLRHPNIVAAYAAGEEGGATYFAMELVDGPALSELIQEFKRSPPPELQACGPQGERIDPSGASTKGAVGDATLPGGACAPMNHDVSLANSHRGYFIAMAELIADVAAGLQYAHQKDVIHRDVKPSNLLLSRDGKIHISDFGLARIAHDPGLTRTGDIMGSPYYMAPEQASPAAGVVDARTDVYGLGATLYEVLTLRPPFLGNHRQHVISRIAHDEPTPPRSINRLVPRDLDTICLKALEKKPARRYQTAGDFADDLRRFVDGRPILARRTTRLEHSVRWVLRHRALAGSLGAICALAGAASFFAYRSHLSELRWTDAQFARLFETAQMAALEGDLKRSGDAINEAERIGAPTSQLLMLRGQVDLQSGRVQDACDKLEAAVQQMPDSLAAHALLANAYQANEQHEKCATMLRLLPTIQPVTLQDYLLLGRAQFSGNFEAASATLDKAVQLDKTSVQARLTRGAVFVERAMDAGNAELAEGALDDLRIASELLEPNPYLLGCVLQARLVAATAYELTGDEGRRREHLKQAALVAESLEQFPDQVFSQRWRAFYFDYVGDDQRAVEVWKTAKDRQIAYLVLALFRLGMVDDALQLCDERLARYPHARFTEFFRSFLLSAKAATPGEFLNAFQLHGPETLDALNAHRFNYVINCLAGDLSAAQEMSRSILASLPRKSEYDPWRAELISYTCGEIDDETLLARSGASRINLCQAHFFIGVTRLADGDRDAARKHFRACADLKVFGYLEDHMSRAYLAQLDRAPTWPRWIPNR